MTHSAAPDLLRPSRNCWRVEDATKVAVIIDADEYFRVARTAMLNARRRIMMVGWDFDARIALDRSDLPKPGPESLGHFLHWLVERDKNLEVYLLRWDIGALKTLLNGRTLLTLARWIWHPRIFIKLDGHHPTGSSHHQKIVVIDDCLAFCGGIDMTGDRWDTRAHTDDDPLRRQPNGKRYDAWHDATTALAGPIAAVLGELCRERWRRAGRSPLEPVTDVTDCWPDGLVPHFENVPVAISRTRPDMDGEGAISEIERLYVDLIGAARRRIYAESQYFASRRIALAIAERLDEPGGPEIVLINPLAAQGWLEPLAMDTARARLIEALRRRDRHGRLRLYHPFTEGGAPIYVHAKILVIDERVLRIGSSNMNNRSMRLDTECDMTVDAALVREQTAEPVIASIRNSLLAEHLGVAEAELAGEIERTGSLIATIERFRRDAGRTLKPYETPRLREVEAWLAENEILDPEGPDEMFEPLAKRGLFRGW